MNAAVERLLSDLAGRSVAVIGREQLAGLRGVVERLSLDATIDGLGSTVIAKSRTLEEWSEVNLVTERAALASLDGAGIDVAPRLLACSPEAGVLVMTDVGHRTVEDVLFGNDANEAEAALVQLAMTAAALHRATIDRPLVAGHDTWTIGTHAVRWPELTAAVDDLGFPSTAAADADAEAVVEALLAPGSFQAFVHGDLTPNNAVIGDDGRCRLVDFEGAAVQHVGVDACMLRFPFAWYGHWALLPSAVQKAMENAYRGRLGRTDEEVDTAMAIGCAAMALVRLHRLPRIADPEQPPELAVRRRVQIMSTVDVTIDAAARAAVLPNLVVWLGELAEAMRERWDEAALPPPIFPAFGDV